MSKLLIWSQIIHRLLVILRLLTMSLRWVILPTPAPTSPHPFNASPSYGAKFLLPRRPSPKPPINPQECRLWAGCPVQNDPRFDSRPKPSVSEACQKASRWEPALVLLQGLRAAPFAPPAEAFRAAVVACDRGAQHLRALWLLEPWLFGDAWGCLRTTPFSMRGARDHWSSGGSLCKIG